MNSLYIIHRAYSVRTSSPCSSVVKKQLSWGLQSSYRNASSSLARASSSSRSCDDAITLWRGAPGSRSEAQSQLDGMHDLPPKRAVSARTAQGGGNSGRCRANLATAFEDIVLRDLFDGYTEWDGQLIGINVFPLPSRASIPTSRFVVRYGPHRRQQSIHPHHVFS